MRNKKLSSTKVYRAKPRDEISRNMSAIRATNNQTETALRKALFARGLRYRKYVANLHGKPDIVFVKAKVAVFVDGDFWHARVLREKGVDSLVASLRTPRQAYWVGKFTKRIERDDLVGKKLEAEGWEVLRLWESEVRRDVDFAANVVAERVRSRATR